MRTLVKFEYRKLWNRVSVAAAIAMCVLSTLHTFIYLNLQWRTIDASGKVVSGLASYRTLWEESQEIEGIMDGEYLQNLKKEYAESADKQYLDEHRGFLGTGGMTKYMYSNYFINYAYYAQYMSNGNDKIGLDYAFLDSQEAFYQKYQEAVKEQIMYEDQYAGLMKFTEAQAEVLEQKISELETPFRVSYYQGISNFMNWYNLEYPIFFIVLAFALACTYAKDSQSGVNELTLSATEGRKKDFRARWIAGNLFTVSVYSIFVGVLLAEHGAIATLGGLEASAQTYWFNCIFNISIGTGVIGKLFGGFLGALVAANFTMLLSCVMKHVKLVSISAVLAVAVLVKLSGTYSQIKLLSPLQFSSDAVVKSFFFCQNALIPYFVIVLLLTMFYVGLPSLFLWRAGKNYHLN